MASNGQAERKAELRTLVKQLSDAVDAFDPPSAGPERPESRKHKIELLTKARHVMLTAMEPADIAQEHVLSMMELVAIRTLLSLKVLPKIPDQGSISLHDLSQATGVQQSLLERLLRLLVGTKFLDQKPDDQYQHTKFSRAYTAFPGPALFYQLAYDHGLLVLDRFHDYLAARGTLSEPEDQCFSPYTWTHGQDGKSIYQIMAQDPEKLKVFQLGMKHLPAVDAVAGYYDFSKLDTHEGEEDRKVLVDVGGGVGNAIATILAEYPQFAKKPDKFVLQDLAEVVELAKREGGLPNGVVKMEHDFFTEQPVKGAKAYYLRHILHNYSDAFCGKILTQLVGAMRADSVVLVSERILPRRLQEADLPVAVLDVTMLNMGGKQRTEDGFREVLEAAGLEIVKVWRPEHGISGLIEARWKGGKD